MIAVTGAGTVTLPGGDAFTGEFSYDTRARVLELAASGDNLDLALGDHFVLLSGTAGLRYGACASS